MPNYFIRRDFIFNNCGFIVIEGTKSTVEKTSRVIRILKYAMNKRKKSVHVCIRLILEVITSVKWRRRFPDLRVTQSQIYWSRKPDSSLH